jgi:hypothetical protein
MKRSEGMIGCISNNIGRKFMMKRFYGEKGLQEVQSVFRR